MKKTVALYGTAAALVLTAVAFDLWSKLTAPSAEAPPPPLPFTPAPPPAPSPIAGDSTARIGDLITLDGALSNSFVRAEATQDLFLQLMLRAKEVPGRTRAPLALAIVIDRSGSMAGEKIEQARSAARQLVDRLADSDEIAVISYATDFTVDVPLTSARASERARIQRTIDQIYDGGGTNLSGGLEAGLAELLRARDRGLAARVIVLSDGNANQGITDPREIARIAQRARLAGNTISAIGLGLDFNEDVMTQIAENGGGSYHYLRDGSEIAATLDRELASMAALAARRVEVGLELAAGVAVQEVYGYPIEARGGRMIIPVGDMTSNEGRRVMVRLSVASGSSRTLPIAKLALSYVPATSDTTQEFSADLGVSSTDDALTLKANERREVTEAVEAILAADSRKQAAASYSAGRRDEAVRSLNTRLKGLRAKAASLGGSGVLEQQAQEIERTIDSMSASEASTDQGKDLVKKEKYRARQVFVY
ncbi:MAG: VWA domain-containing protein [Deltaproteobacteria bacterium]|nr:VWA domain-containing protein [Deltaproteobacteria bacterium]